MENVIKYVVECGSWYGLAALLILAITVVVLAYILSDTVKSVCNKWFNTMKKYSFIHTKTNVGNDISSESELHR